MYELIGFISRTTTRKTGHVVLSVFKSRRTFFKM